MKTVLMYLICFCVFGSVAFAATNEWRVNPTSPAGQDNNWYNPLNWSLGHVPTGTEIVQWRSAFQEGDRFLVINSGTANSSQCNSGNWNARTASFTVTGGAIYNTSYLTLWNSASDAAHSPCNVAFTINGGSTVNLSGEAQIGRKTIADNPAIAGQATITIDGVGSILNQTSGYWWMGWDVGKTEQTTMNIINGGVANFNGLAFKPDGITIVPVIYLGIGSKFTVKTNRTAAVASYIAANELKPYNGIGSISYSYDASTDLTTVTNIPEPVTIALLGLGAAGLFLRNRK